MVQLCAVKHVHVYYMHAHIYAIQLAAHNEHIWDQKEVAYCKCTAKQKPHAHCPCDGCKGNTVFRSTERRHWENTLQVAAL